MQEFDAGGLISAGVELLVKSVLYSQAPRSPTEGAFFWLEFTPVTQGVDTCTQVASCCTLLNEITARNCRTPHTVAGSCHL